jgi:alkanesulfonate monooxygenase SsuD/methylene tetrahydromethanopterin reductase-like flavin-dependent oxidoreductase (luciferase family)
MIKFGYCLPIFAWPGKGLFRTPAYPQLDTATTMKLGKLAEDLGYHSIWVADHLMLGKDEAILEGWTTLCAIAGMTQRVQIGIIHYNNTFRHPALTAKVVATLDQISAGRYIHFVDYGNQAREFLAYGLHVNDTIEDRIAHMNEGVEIALKLWTSDSPVTFEGKYYGVKNAVLAPKPAQRPHPPIWLGEAHPMIMEATAKYAQGWNSVPVGLPELRRRLGLLRDACAKVNRNYDEIEKTFEIQVLVANSHDELREKIRAMLALVIDDAIDPALSMYLSGATDELPAMIKDTWLAGTPDEVAAQIREYTAEGVTHFMLWFVDAPDDSGLRLFAEQVMPQFAN